MEHAGGVDLLESSCFGPDLTVSVDESVDVVAQLFGNGLFSTDTSSHEPIELESLTSMYWPDGDGAGSNHGHGWGRGACTGGGGGSTTAGHVVLLPSLELEGHDQYLNVVGPDDDDVDAMRDVAGFLVDVVEDERCDATKEVLVDDHACYVDETSNGSSGSVVNYLHMTSSFTSSLDHKHPPKRRLAVLELQKENDSHGSPQKKKKKKKVQKNGRRIKNEESRSDQNKNRKVFKQEEENDSSGSEEEACQSQDTNEEGGGVSSGGPKTGKSRAGRGSATDPQSIYARKRRERINERLKILQTLVPNGTKVDISTMLEEAVQYVKFLQLQIKLLSSDDLWMYAPIAYNGMSIGLDLKISPSH